MAAPDAIELRGLHVSGIVGVLPQEREVPQPLELDLDVVLDLGPAAASDGLGDTVDYGALCALAETVVLSTRYELLERLAAHVADDVLATDDRIAAVTVWLRKLRPPVAQRLDTSGVRITRTRT